MLYRLVILNGALKGQRVTVYPEPMTVGRDPGCDIALPDPECAVRHAALELQEDELIIRDLGSMNRILVNKREVRVGRLKHGDIIEIGRTRLLLQAFVQAEVSDAYRRGAGRSSRRARRLARALPLVALAAVAALAAGRLVLRSPNPPPAAEDAPARESPATEPAVEDTTPPAPETSATPLTSNDLRRLTDELSAIRVTVSELAAASETGPATADNPSPATALLEELVRKARLAAAEGQLAEADQLLSSALAMDPGFLDAHEERARQFERRGMVKKALQEWQAVLVKTDDADRRAAAETEFQRLQRQDRTTAAEDSLVLRVASVEPFKLPPGADGVEIRTVRIGLEPMAAAWALDPDAVRIEGMFYMRDSDGAAPRAGPAACALSGLRRDQAWRAGEPRFITATCALAPTGPGESPPAYLGFRLRIFYAERLQGECVRPLNLIEIIGDEAAPAREARVEGSTDAG